MWGPMETIPFQLRAIPLGVLVLFVLFAVCAYGRRREVSELKDALRGLQDHVGASLAMDENLGTSSLNRVRFSTASGTVVAGLSDSSARTCLCTLQQRCGFCALVRGD
jgi:hypothetical protein